MTDVPRDYAEIVRSKRLGRGWTQTELAEHLGLTNVTISRWEKSKVEPSNFFWEKFLAVIGEQDKDGQIDLARPMKCAVDFMGNGQAVRAIVEGERLAYGHLANPAFATEVSKIDAL